jgi:para-aminobenzoate synthetase/4-amino-4-deoxychorismate lyase
MKPTTLNTVILFDAVKKQWLRFASPKKIITVSNVIDVVPALHQLGQVVETKGLYAAGFLSYESAPAFDDALRVNKNEAAFPLLWFGLYDKPSMVSPRMPESCPAYTVGAWQPSVRLSDYKKNIRRIKSFISRGETYQVNYTFRLRAPFHGNEWRYFFEFASAARAEYCAFIDTGRFVICSASPELFFHHNNRLLVSRPMKGTAARGRFTREDEQQRLWLASSEKNRAENIMIVDMIRNDMGRIADTGTIHVKNLFSCERYPAVWQMTSTVASKTRASVAEIFSALFPCASITGAPKVSTTRIIARLEKGPRRIYTGCIGYFAPKRKARFNVAIRTVLIDRKCNKAEYGVGGGIVWQSDPDEEYKECLVKASGLLYPEPEFSLLESILWRPGKGYFLLKRHLNRVLASAKYFGFYLQVPALQKRLGSLSQSLAPRPHKVRLLVARNGKITCGATVLSPAAFKEPVRLRLAHAPVDSAGRFLFHKTTNRRVYDRAAAGRSGCDDVVLWNESGEITETCTANIVVQKNGRLITPKTECGLLAGTFREHLLEKKTIREEIITTADLRSAEKIYIINSVRKWREAVLLISE